MKAGRKTLLGTFVAVTVGAGIIFGSTVAQAASCEDKHPLEIIRDNFEFVETAGPGSGDDGLFNRTDLAAVTNDDHNPQYVRDAAAYVLNNGSLFDQVDGARTGGRLDGLINSDDLEVTLFVLLLQGCG